MGIVRIDAGIEMISTILYFSNHYKIFETIVGGNYKPLITEDYYDDLKKWIDPYLKHDIFTYVDELTYKGFFFGRPMEIMCATEFETMILKETLSDVCIEYSGGIKCIEKLLALLKDFAKVTDYKYFFENIKKYYLKPINYFNDHYDLENIIMEVNKFYGYHENSYHIIWTDLQKGSYGIHFNDFEKLKIFSVYTMNGCSDFTEKRLETACGAFSLNVIIHEFSHPYVNPLTERYSKEVNEYKEAYDMLSPYRLPGILSGYGDWTECVNEHIVRAISIHISKKLRTSEGEQWHYNKSYNAGYRYLPLLLEKLNYYDANRDKYVTFGNFYLELIEVFSTNI